MKKSKLIFEIVFFVLITGLTGYYLYASGVFQHIDEIRNVSIGGILSILLAVLIYVCCDAFIIYRNMKSIRNEARLLDGLGVYAMGNLGSGVTPWKSAHFPMIAYYVRKRGYNTEETLSIMASNQMIYSLTLPVLYSFFMIYAIVMKFTVQIGSTTLPLFLACLIGVVTNIGYFTVLMLMLYHQRFQKWILELKIKIRRKLRRLPNEEEFRKEKLLKMQVYRQTADRMRKNLVYNLPSVIAYVLFMLSCYGIPYFIYLALAKESFVFSDYLYCFMLCQAMSYVTNIVPVPGGMIAAEFSFVTAFQGFMGSYVNVAVLLYRFFTYILLILLDFVFFAVFQILINIRDSKAMREENPTKE